MSFQILTRDVPPRSAWALEQAGIHPLLSRLFAARGILSPEELDDGLTKLLAPNTLMGTQEAAILLANAISQNLKLCIVADYDCDGATACAVGLRGLRMLGAQHVSYIVPDRVVDGYGLTASIAKRVKDSGADVLITVDNGIASIEGVAMAQSLGMQVLITDHHLPAEQVPNAEVIVNPNQAGCTLATTFDFGFALGPRINAAGRLSDMTLGIECLTTDDALRADELARQLDAINRERRDIEGDMRQQAMEIAESLLDESDAPPPAVCVFDPDFHEGVVGIVASRIKDKFHRPCFVFAASNAPGKEHELKGSGRSIPGFHLRDALDLMAKKHPHMLLRFGGHAMAAGCTIEEENLEQFETSFMEVAAQLLSPATLQRKLETDGPLDGQYRRAEFVEVMHREVWGQGFPPPVFSEEVDVVSQRLVGEKHLALKLKHQGQSVDGIWFGRIEPLPARVKLAYRLDVDEWQGQKRVRFLVEAAEI